MLILIHKKKLFEYKNECTLHELQNYELHKNDTKSAEKNNTRSKMAQLAFMNNKMSFI